MMKIPMPCVIPTTFSYGLGKIIVTASIYQFLPLIYFVLFSAECYCRKCFCRVQDMMTSNDGNSKMMSIYVLYLAFQKSLFDVIFNVSQTEGHC